MIRAAGILLLSAASCLAQPNWQSQLTPPEPGSFPPFKPLRVTYRLGWMGIPAGATEATFSRTRPEQFQLDVKGGTIGLARTLWRLDATHTARASASTLRPISLRQTEVYPWQTVRTEIDFNDESATRFRESTSDKTPARRKRLKFRNLYDIHSALLFIRSQRLKPGDTYNLVVCPQATPYLATVRVTDRERVQVRAGKFDAIKTELKLQKVNPDLTLEPHQKFKRGVFWLSDDTDRLLIKAQADIFIGSVWLELEQVQIGR